MKMRTAAAAVMLICATPALAATQAFEVDTNHTILGFKAETVLFDVPGRFQKYKVQVSGDPATGAEAKIRIEIDARSIFTDNGKRDEHLRSDDFFDVAKYPKIIFTSTKATQQGGKLVVEGTLEMHGVKKDLRLPFDVVTAKNGAGNLEHVFKATLPLNRKEFGIGSDSLAAKISMKEEVQLNLLLAGFFAAPKAQK